MNADEHGWGEGIQVSAYAVSVATMTGRREVVTQELNSFLQELGYV